MLQAQNQIIRANGIDFNVAVAGCGDRLALCLHGFPELSYSWRHQIPLLVRLGYRVWAPDLRGYGGSSRPIGVGAYSLDELVTDVAALIQVSGAKDVLLIGHDWGAMIAWHYAMFRTPAISKLIIMNVPHPALFAKGLRTLRQLKKSWYIFFFQLPWLPEWALARRGAVAIGRMFRAMAVDKTRFPADVLRVYQDAASQPGALTAMLNYYRALFRTSRHSRLPLTRIEVPTLMLWGEEDGALGKELTYDTDQYVRNLTQRYLPGVSHWVQQEAPETVNAMMEAWLTGGRVPDAPAVTASK